MAITIRELIASDTISEAVNKINFNFDQLMLNGGGPQGPVGAEGPDGPIGGRGIRGSQWFEDPSSTGTEPTGLTFGDLEEGDNYLQSNGVVWEWNGNIWVITNINLRGPNGATGSTAFSRFGNPITNQQSIYPSPIPDGISGGANSSNEAMPSVLIGGFISNTPPTAGITYDKSLVTDTMATSMSSDNSSMYIRQLDTDSALIRFLGGSEINNYEQNDVTKLASIHLDADDRLRIQVPKAPVDISSLTAMTGWTVFTDESGQYIKAGKHIKIETGTSSTNSTSAFEISDFIVNVNKSGGAISNPKIQLNVSGIINANLLIGSVDEIEETTSKTGTIAAEGGLIGLTSSSDIAFWAAKSIISTSTKNIVLRSGNDISITSGGGSSDTITLQSTVNKEPESLSETSLILSGSNHIETPSNTEVSVIGDQRILLSGKFEFTSGAYTSFIGNYTRVGNVVTVFGVVDNPTAADPQFTLPKPLVSSSGTNSAIGHGTLYDSYQPDNNNYDRNVAIIDNGNSNVLVKKSSGTDESVDDFATYDSIYISFSYIIEVPTSV